MRIPEVRLKLQLIANQLKRMEEYEIAGEIEDLIGQMYRRRRAPERAPIAAPITPELQRDIRAYAKSYPKLTQVEVGQVFSVNRGRVSEALYGKRH